MGWNFRGRRVLRWFAAGAILAGVVGGEAFAAHGHGPSRSVRPATQAHAAAPVRPATDTASLSGQFHRALEPKGRWLSHRRWGEAWKPSSVAANWRPYKTGKWLYTDEWGWYWAADEDWGWITYHYGRWAFDPDDGWIWVPGTEWAPSWVRWRRGGHYIGWAALPPDEIVEDEDDAPGVWVFVDSQDLIAPEIDSVVLSFSDTPTFIRETVVVNQTIIVERSDRTVIGANPGIPPSIVAAAAKRPVQTFVVHPRVLAGTAGVTGATTVQLSGRGKISGGDVVRAREKLIQPAASIPRPTRLQTGKVASTGPDSPSVLKGALRTSTKRLAQLTAPSTPATQKTTTKTTTKTEQAKPTTPVTEAQKKATKTKETKTTAPSGRVTEQAKGKTEHAKTTAPSSRVTEQAKSKTQHAKRTATTKAMPAPSATKHTATTSHARTAERHHHEMPAANARGTTSTAEKRTTSHRAASHEPATVQRQTSGPAAHHQTVTPHVTTERRPTSEGHAMGPASAPHVTTGTPSATHTPSGGGHPAASGPVGGPNKKPQQ